MKFKIPHNAVKSNAAVIGVVSLVRFLQKASKDPGATLKEIGWLTEAPTILDIKEAFFIYLYKKLLSKEFNHLKQPSVRMKTPFSQYMDFVLETASRVILNLDQSASGNSIKYGNLQAYSPLQASAEGINAEKMIKYFYMDFLSSVYGFYLDMKMKVEVKEGMEHKEYINDFKKIELRTTYMQARIKHCRLTIYSSMQDLKLNQDVLETGDEEKMTHEIIRFVKKLSAKPFTAKVRLQIRPITRYVVCGNIGEDEDEIKKHLSEKENMRRVIRLNADEKKGNIDLRASQIEKGLGKELSEESKDLLSIAGYLYVGDTMAHRGNRWRRRLHFIIPVRNVEFWESQTELLSYSVSFLSGDSISFKFCEYTPVKDVNKDEKNNKKKFKPDCTCLLSGGIDSFCGTLKFIKEKKQPIIISHFCQNGVAGVQGNLVNYLEKTYGKYKLLHLRLKIGKKTDKNQLPRNLENTQRTRSFLYFSLATIAAVECGLNKIFITENGISSFNLPITQAFASTRCGRPTHPRNIYNFNQIVNKLYRKKIDIQNPYSLKTKSELIKEAIESSEEEKQLNNTATCPRFGFSLNFDERRKGRKLKDNSINNCGICYECILRIVSIYGAGNTPDFEKYILNPLDKLKELNDSELTTLIRFISYCMELEVSSDQKMLHKYPELCLPKRYFPGIKDNDICESAIKLHKRFAGEFLNWVVKESDSEFKQMTGIYQEKPCATVDIHCHVDKYTNPFYILSKAKYENVKIISVANNPHSSRITFNLSNYFDSIIPSAGFHPLEVPKFDAIENNLSNLFKYMDRTQFIGEIGLDHYFEKDKNNFPSQKKVFGKILEHYRGKNKIFNVHSKGAETDVLEMLEQFEAKKVILHWFAGEKDLLSRIIENQFYVSINRAIKYSKKIKNMVNKLPRDLILTESDGPEKYRNHQHSPFDIPEVLLEISKIWGISKEETQLQILDNFKKLVGK